MTATNAMEVHEAGRMAAPARIEDMKAFLARVSSPAGFEEQQQLAAAYDAACRALIGAGDVQVDGDREFKKKSAWRKLGRHFSISTIVVSSKIDYVAEPDVNSDRELILVATVVVRGIAIWGQHSEAIGVCATDEEVGQRVITIADALATAETRATNRAVSNLIAMGEVSAEEIQRGDGTARSSEAPQRQKKPAGDIKVPFGPSKGTKLRDMETGDLTGAMEWAEDKSKFSDFVAAAKEELESRKPKPVESAVAAEQKELTLEEARAFPFPFQKGKANHGRPMGSFSTPHLQELKGWIVATQKDNNEPDFHKRTVAVIDLIIADREKDQTKLDLGASEKAQTVNKGTPFEATVVESSPGKPEPSRIDATGPGGPQEAKTPAPATGGGPQSPAGGGQPHPPGRVRDALEPDPTSKMGMYARIKKALESPAISQEARTNYSTDNINGFKESKGAKSLEWWVEALERTARMDPNSFPSALEDTAQPGKDGLPF